MLVIRRGGLGDTLLMAPVCAALRRRAISRHGRPVELHFAGDEDQARVLAHYGVVDCAFSSEDLALYALGLSNDRGDRARRRLSSYAAIVSDDATVAVHLPSGSVATFDPRPNRDDLAIALQVGGQLGLEIDLADARLRQENDHAAAASGPVVFAPGSGGKAKCWPRERWLELARSLLASGESVLCVVGPAERERDDPRAWGFAPATQWLTDVPCTALAQRLEQARAFVGNDSGTTHLAAMLMVPTVAIFGPSESRVYRPQGGRVEILGERTEGPPQVAVSAVLGALSSVLA